MNKIIFLLLSVLSFFNRALFSAEIFFGLQNRVSAQRFVGIFMLCVLCGEILSLFTIVSFFS